MNQAEYKAAKDRQADASARLCGIMAAMLRHGHVLSPYLANAQQAVADYDAAARDAMAACEYRRTA